MEQIGIVHYIQVQRDRLKVGEAPNRVYRTDPLLNVDLLRLTPHGIYGLLMDGSELIDVHHVDHPATRNNNNVNGVSFNFLSNYEAIQARFGGQAKLGCGGENILIQATRPVSAEEFQHKRLRIQAPDGDPVVDLDEIVVAAPCEPFSCYLAGERLSGAALKETLQFLNDGMRGYYATLQASDAVVISRGDLVYLVEA